MTPKMAKIEIPTKISTSFLNFDSLEINLPFQQSLCGFSSVARLHELIHILPI